jgi:hypothetical protein
LALKGTKKPSTKPKAKAKTDTNAKKNTPRGKKTIGD